MFARVITAHIDEQGSENVIRLAEEQLPDARHRLGFAGFLVLIDDAAAKALTISLWNTREDMDAVAQGTTEGIHDEGVAEAGTGSLQLETYEVAVRA